MDADVNKIPFQVVVFGEFGPRQVRVLWNDEHRPPHPELDALVAETWARKLAECQRTGQILFNGQLARYLRHRIEDGVLVIDAGPTDYVNFVGTNMLNHARADEFGWELFSNPIGTSAIVVTSDGWLLFGRRNHRVAPYGGYMHMFGGGLEAKDRRCDGTVDGFGSIRRELNEELDLYESDIDQIVCLGLVEERRIRQPEMIFDTQVSYTRAQISERIRPDHPDEEHTGVEACWNAPDAIVPFVRSIDLIAPVAVGAIFQHGRRRFGEAWYRAAIDELARP